MKKWIEEYRDSLKMIEVEEVLDLIIYRPLAFVFVKLIYPTNLTPNQITYIALIVGVFASLLYTTADPFNYVIAGVLLIIYDVLDCSDGQLARLKRNGTMVGRIVDGFSDYIVTITAYVCIGIGLARGSENNIFIWVLTIAAGLSNFIHSFSLDFYRNRFMDVVLKRNMTLGESLNEFEQEYLRIRSLGKYNFDRLLIWIYLKYSRLQLFFAPDDSQVSGRIYDSEEYYRNNKRILHLWTYLGPTSELTFLIVCSMINRLDVYLWGMVTVGNVYALGLFLAQKYIDSRLTVPGTA